MRLIVGSIVGSVVLLVGIYGAGSALPEDIVTTRVVQYRTAPEQIWEALSDYEKLPQWNDHITAARQIPNPGSDKPLWHLEDSFGNNMVIEVKLSASQVLHKVELVENDLPFTGLWEFDLMEKDGGTLVKLRETTHIPNPFIRFGRYYIFGMDVGMRHYLEALGDHFLEDVTVKEAAL